MNSVFTTGKQENLPSSVYKVTVDNSTIPGLTRSFKITIRNSFPPGKHMVS